MSELKEETTIDIIEAEEPVEKDRSEDSAKTEVSDVKEKNDAASEASGQESESGAETELAERTGETETSEQQEKSDTEAPAAPAFDADAYLEQLAEAKRSITAGIVIYKGRINEKLQERTPEGYNALTSIINEPQYDRISQYDSELARFKTSGTIYQMEAGAEPVTIYDSIEYLDDYTIVYEQMMFFLRRMQFGLDYSDYMIWLQEWCLTVHFVVQMLQESELGEKGRVAVILADLYQENGQKNEAVYLLNMMMEQCGEEEKALLTERLEKLQES